MINVSNLYKEAVYAPSRKTTALVELQLLNNEAYEAVGAVTTSSEASVSRKDQVTNKVRRMSKRYATFEPDYFLLDGSFYIAPLPTENPFSELGWWSGVLCDASGSFDSTQNLSLTLTTPQDSIGITVTFDPGTGEYATDFVFAVYDASWNTLAYQEITGNASPYFVYATPISGYTYVFVNTRRWNKPYRRARITEVDFGVIQTYDGTKLMSVNLLEEMNVVGDTLPSNEIKFVVDNSDKGFNLLNPQGYYKYLEKGQEVSLSVGLETRPGTFEYVSFNKYYLTDWQSDENKLTTTFTARDFLDTLDAIDYISIANTNLYDLAKDIFIKAGITSYSIDPELQDISTQGFKTIIDSRKALQCIGIAGKAAVYQDRTLGIPMIKRFAELDERTTFLSYAGEPDMIAGTGTYILIDGDYLMKSINFDNAYNQPQIKLDDPVKTLAVTVSTYISDTHEQVLSTTVKISSTETVFFAYQKPIKASTAELTVIGATSFSVLNSYDLGIEISLIAAGDVAVAVSGITLATHNTVYNLSDPSLKTGSTLTVDNPLINTAEQALEVGNWLATEFRARAVYSISWRQNPALECGDIVLVEDSFGNKKQSRITKQEYVFSGYLGGKSETKGGV